MQLFRHSSDWYLRTRNEIILNKGANQIGSGNEWVSPDNEPLFEPILTNDIFKIISLTKHITILILQLLHHQLTMSQI